MRWTEAGTACYTHMLWLRHNIFKHFESNAARSTFPVIGAASPMLEAIRCAIWGKQLNLHDDLFGQLTTERINGRGRPIGDPPIYEWYGVVEFPGASVEQFCIHAPENGPSDIQHNAWRNVIKNRTELTVQIEEHLFANYQRHRQCLLDECYSEYGDHNLKRFRRWKEYASKSQTSIDRPWQITICCDATVDISLFTEWDDDHNLRLFIQNGRVCDWTLD